MKDFFSTPISKLHCWFYQRKQHNNFVTLAILSLLLCSPLFLETIYAADIWDSAKNIMNDVYTKILGLANVAAAVCASVALFLMFFGKSSRTVEESRMWLKRIVIAWIALNSIGWIISYLITNFNGGTTIPS